MTGAQRNSTAASGAPEIARPSPTVPPNSTAPPSFAFADNYPQISASFLVTTKLNGHNYLDGRGKIGHLTGETTKPAADDPNVKRWQSKNSLIIGWLINSMEPTIGKPHLFLPTTKDVWEAVWDLYLDLENSSQIFDLKTRLWKSKQNDRDVTTYYNELVTLWQELDQCYDDVWENPNEAARHMKREENDRVYMFLGGLNRNLDEVMGRILGRKPLPPMREVFSEVRCEESRRKIMLHKTVSDLNLEPNSSALVSKCI
ncbi:uncharacterized protein LOC111400518 [Olea europaea var. sylvestris]|uniref:uncharacterized protein LOC111400518 n=1 Tax=Olea europaea var. sylvestris TaxID=158386 RepID=UPI000C1D4F23|nr:uncharacterized protein LOC111400518 [Olea europaea var. sylvestris]